MSAVDSYRFEVIPRERDLQWILEAPDVEGLSPIGRASNGGTAYVSENLMREVQSVREAGVMAEDTLYHCTNSAALPFIAQQKALLASADVIRIYGTLVSGEQAQDARTRIRGLTQVFSGRDAANLQYSFTNNRDGIYPVTFGLEGLTPEDRGPEGLEIGSRVPLDHVVSLIAPNERLPEALEWAELNCPRGTFVMSYLAVAVLGSVQLQECA